MGGGDGCRVIRGGVGGLIGVLRGLVDRVG